MQAQGPGRGLADGGAGFSALSGFCGARVECDVAGRVCGVGRGRPAHAAGRGRGWRSRAFGVLQGRGAGWSCRSRMVRRCRDRAARSVKSTARRAGRGRMVREDQVTSCAASPSRWPKGYQRPAERAACGGYRGGAEVARCVMSSAHASTSSRSWQAMMDGMPREAASSRSRVPISSRRRGRVRRWVRPGAVRGGGGPGPWPGRRGAAGRRRGAVGAAREGGRRRAGGTSARSARPPGLRSAASSPTRARTPHPGVEPGAGVLADVGEAVAAQGAQLRSGSANTSWPRTSTGPRTRGRLAEEPAMARSRVSCRSRKGRSGR